MESKDNNNLNNDKLSETVQVPDTISVSFLNSLANNKKANKEKRIEEILKRMQLSKDLKNMAMAERVIERRVEMGLMSADYELINKEEQAYSNGTAQTQIQQSRPQKTKGNINSFKGFLQSILNEINEDDNMKDIIDELDEDKGCIVFLVNGMPVSVTFEYVVSLIEEYAQLTGIKVPDKVKKLIGKETLTDDDMNDVSEFMAKNKKFTEFVVHKKMND